MARTRKSIQALNLNKYDVLIEDKGTRSDYFKITQFDGYFYGGRNAFLIAGASILKPGSSILVEILNANGETVYSAPVSNFIEGGSRLIQVEVYNDTPIGPGKIVVLGSATTYLDGTPLPAEWLNKYNVRWMTDAVISPLVNNKAPIRFLNNPVITIEEKFYPVPATASFSQSLVNSFGDYELTPVAYNTTQNGYLIKLKTPTGANGFTSDQLNGEFETSVTIQSSSESINTKIPITRIYNTTLAESRGVLITSSLNTRIEAAYISGSGSGYVTSIQPVGTVTVSDSINKINYKKLIESSDTGSATSFAKIRIANLNTISGEINKIRVSYKVTTETGNSTTLADVPVVVEELLSIDSGSKIVNLGEFHKIKTDDYWYAATMSLARNDVTTPPAYYFSSSINKNLSITSSSEILLDSICTSPELSGSLYKNSGSYYIGTTNTAQLSLLPNSEYTLKFNALFRQISASVKLTSPDTSMEVYLVQTEASSTPLLELNTKGQLLGTLTPIATQQYFENVEFNFKPKIITPGKFGLRFVVYGGFWNIAGVSVKPAEEKFFSPDEVTLLIPTVNRSDKLLTFKAEFLDIDNNSSEISVTSLPTYFTGSSDYVKKTGDYMTGELYIKGLPIQQQALQDAFTGLVSGGLITVNTPASWSYTISSGSGYIVDNYTDPLNPTYQYVTWPEITKIPGAFITTGSIASYPRTNIAISASGQVIEQSAEWTPLDYRKYIILGRLAHVGTPFIQRTVSFPLTTYNRGFHWFDLANAIGIINAEGNVYYPSGSSMRIGKTEGKTYRVGSNYRNNTAYPDITSDPASLPTQFAYRYRSGSGFAETPVTTVITGSLYDNGSGILQTVNPNQFTIQRIYYFGATNTTRIQFGQTVYGTLRDAAAAIGSEVFVADPNLTRDSSLRAYLIVGSRTTNLSDISQAEFVSTGKFGTGGGAGGGGGAANLSELNDVSLNGLSAGQLLQYNGTAWSNGINVNTLATTGSNNFVGNQVITGSLFISGSSTLTNIGPAIFSGSLNVTDGITGTLQTVAQPNVTSVGTLSSLAVNGDVGIGTTSPTKKLHVVGGGLFSGSAASTDLKLSDSATNTDLHMFFQNADIAQIASFNKTLAAGSKTLWITSDVLTLNTFNGSSYSTRWQINSAGHLLAGSDNTYDIGANGSNRPRNLFLAGSVTAASVTASLFGTSSAATSASYVEYVNVGNTPSLVSASSQVSYTGLSDIPSDIVSSSVQATTWTVATASFATTASFASSTLFNARGFSLYAPTDAENMTLFYTNVSLTLASITSVLRADVSPTPNVSYTVRYGSDRSATGTSVTSASISTSNRTTGQTNTAFSNGTIPANNFIWLTTSAVSGVVEELSVTLIFT